MPSTIQFKLLPDGGFVCGDSTTGLTSYAYPTSEFAVKAKKRGQQIAVTMLRSERLPGHPLRVDYDKRNWGRLWSKS